MTSLGLARHCAEIRTQSGLLADHAQAADPATTPVPTCPGWNLGQLLLHVGTTHRWAETVVRTRAAGPVPDDGAVDLPAAARADGAALAAWLTEGAARLAATLRAAGPDAPVWTVAPGGTAAFWARRMTHETALHRADAALAVGAPYVLDADVAADALDEWTGFSTLPQAYESAAGLRELLAPGRTLALRATDAPAGWLVDLSGDSVTCRRAPEDGPAATATVRGPLTDLLLLVYGRPAAPGVEITGDARLFDSWRERAGFWMRK